MSRRLSGPDRIAEAPLPQRTRKALRAAGIETVAQLVRRTPSDLRAVPGLSEEAAHNIERWLAEHGRGPAPPRKGYCPGEWVERTLRDGALTFSERERFILRRRHGLDGGEPASYPKLAAALGVSKQRIGQLVQRAESRVISHMVHDRGESGLPMPKTTRTVHCEHCGGPFERPTGSGRRCCSDACRRALSARKRRRPDSRFSRFGTVTLRCDGCGQRFQRSRYQHSLALRGAAARGIDKPRTFCSRACYLRYGIGSSRKRKRKRRGSKRSGEAAGA